jgi:hypothetical protein
VSCESSDFVKIEIPFTAITKSFAKLRSITREENRKKLGKIFNYWYGEDNTDGSTFNYVQDENGDIHGSLIDIARGFVFQFHSKDGIPSVTITKSDAFPPEIHVDERNLDNQRRKIRSKRQNKSKKSNRISKKLKKSKSPKKLKKSKKSKHLKKLMHSKKSKSTLKIDNIYSTENKEIMQEEEVPVVENVYDDKGGNLDVMVVWTKDAECEHAGIGAGCTPTAETTASMHALINLAIEESNTAFKLSGVDTELLLAYSYRHPTYSIAKNGFSNSLVKMKKGQVSGVHENREKYGADIVVLLADEPNRRYCGIGYVGPLKDSMYSVTSFFCATGYFSFSHEIGHNLGLLHDRGTADACDANHHRFGYRDPNAQFRSILAYGCRRGQCDENPADGSCTRVQRFSNVNSLYNGAKIGTKKDNNAKAINDVRGEVAGYFAHVPVTVTT